ncbi:TolC family protein [Robbsia sp. KACC 23696]|uniref:TolC family protein n=1 Tax=Robbsia sp. KACC 23696 TaxID=3149231 RepID=UPI00325A6813
MRIGMIGVMSLLAGCQSYQPKPLTVDSAALDKTRFAHLSIDPATLPLPGLRAYRFDPSDGFDPMEVAMIAVTNNPDLRLARDDAHIAQAQAFAAHLLPDPQIQLSGTVPTPALDGNNITAYAYGLDYDLITLLTHRIAAASANATAKQADLNMVWQEWQTALHAQQLFYRVQRDRAVLPLLDQQQQLATERLKAYQNARTQRAVTDDTLTIARVAWQDAHKQFDDAARTANQDRHDFNLLLGLTPDVVLPLSDASGKFDASTTTNDARVHRDADRGTPTSHASDAGSPTCLSARAIDDALQSLPQRRADLLALRAGYVSQDAKYRLSIWQQFPSFNIGLSRQQDNSGYKDLGITAGFTLPIFNRNRGNIAIESATRQRLFDEYNNRVDAAHADVAQARADCAVLMQQRATLDEALPHTASAADEAAHAYQDRDVTIGVYTDAMIAALTRRVESLTLHEALAEERLTLTTLLGLPLDAGSLATPPQSAVAQNSVAPAPATASPATHVADPRQTLPSLEASQ